MKPLARLKGPVLVGGGAMVVSGLAVLALHVMGHPEWGRLGSGQRMPHVLTGGLLVLPGLAWCTLGRWSERLWAWRVALGVHGLVSAVALGALISAGSSTATGAMPAPATAVGFLLAGGAAACISPQGQGRRGWVGLALGAGLALLALLQVLAGLTGAPVLLGPAFVPSAFLTSLGLFTLGGTLAVASFSRVTLPAMPSAQDRGIALRMAGLACGVYVAAGGGAWYAYRASEREHLREVTQQLATIADLKSEGLLRYRREREQDGALLQDNPTMTGLVARLLVGPRGNEAERELLVWIRRLLEGGEYDAVRVVDHRGDVRLRMPETALPLSPTLREALKACLSQRSLHFQDLYRSENDQRIRMALLVPVFGAGGSPLGAFILRIDPEEHLYPWLGRWPVPSLSGHSLLVRREGEEVVLLNPTSRAPDGALRIRRPLAEVPRMPIALAVQGVRGWIHGFDHRGVHVLAHAQPVLGTPWFLVARMDGPEAFAPLRGQLIQILVFAFLLCALVTAGLAFLWRQQDIRVLDERLRREQERRRFEAQLTRSQKMESLGSLAGGVAHDMNNVLGAILGLASAHVELQPAGSPAHKAFETIAKAARRGGGMVRGLLDFSRQGLAEEQPVDFNALIREEVELLSRTTLAQVDCRLELDPQVRPIRGDSGSLAHVLMNLCVNAVDAMPSGGTLTLRTCNRPDGRVQVEVQDTGTGMSPEVSERALEPFFTTKPHGKGTGLGLSIVYGTVKAHQGKLAFRSTPGRGTTVVLHFPALVGAQDEPGTGSPVSGRDAMSRWILLVDDDELVRQSTQALLEVMGHRVVAVDCGEKALQYIQGAGEVDLVVLDLNMPGLGGAGTLPLIRGLRRDLPVLLATGRADQAALDLAAAHPGVGLVAKPFSLQDLRRSIAATSA